MNSSHLSSQPLDPAGHDNTPVCLTNELARLNASTSSFNSLIVGQSAKPMQRLIGGQACPATQSRLMLVMHILAIATRIQSAVSGCRLLSRFATHEADWLPRKPRHKQYCFARVTYTYSGQSEEEYILHHFAEQWACSVPGKDISTACWAVAAACHQSRLQSLVLGLKAQYAPDQSSRQPC